jgi:hypothetical protein
MVGSVSQNESTEPAAVREVLVYVTLKNDSLITITSNYRSTFL